MLKTSLCRLMLVVGPLALHVISGVKAKDDGLQWLVSPELLRHAKLKMVWQNELPIKETESLDQLFIIADRIYALSDHNYMVCLDREKGNVIFSRPVAPAGFPVVGLELYQDELISIIGNKLVEIDPNTGIENKAKYLEFSVACPVVRNGSYFYVSGADRRLHVLHAENYVQVFEVAAENDSMITSIIADERFVVFGTDAGNVISMLPDRPRWLWQFDATDAIAGPIVRDGVSLFFACKDTNVYRLDIVGPMMVKLIWKYQMPGLLEKAPHVTPEVVYQYARNGGLTAIDKQSGKFMWSLPQGADLLAEASPYAYVLTNVRCLVVMDNTRAKKLYSVNFAGVSRFATNTTDSKIYIADKRGRLACLEPAE
ncbi:MAG: PQQ-binding-like beta-propeller repeat protein [Sedimentisphaerales bacterium]